MPGSVIVGDARTPIGKLSGALKGFVDLRGIAYTSLLLRIADRRYLRAALPRLRIANDLTGDQEVATLALAAACTVPRLPAARQSRDEGLRGPRTSRLQGGCRTRRCSNGVVTPRWRSVFSPARSGQLRRAPAVHFVRGSERVSAGVTTAVAARYRGGAGR